MLTSAERFLGGASGQSDRGLARVFHTGELLYSSVNAEHRGQLLTQLGCSKHTGTGLGHGQVKGKHPVSGSPRVPQEPKVAIFSLIRFAVTAWMGACG